MKLRLCAAEDLATGEMVIGLAGGYDECTVIKVDPNPVNRRFCDMTVYLKDGGEAVLTVPAEALMQALQP